MLPHCQTAMPRNGAISVLLIITITIYTMCALHSVQYLTALLEYRCFSTSLINNFTFSPSCHLKVETIGPELSHLLATIPTKDSHLYPLTCLPWCDHRRHVLVPLHMSPGIPGTFPLQGLFSYPLSLLHHEFLPSLDHSRSITPPHPYLLRANCLSSSTSLHSKNFWKSYLYRLLPFLHSHCLHNSLQLSFHPHHATTRVLSKATNDLHLVKTTG